MATQPVKYSENIALQRALGMVFALMGSAVAILASVYIGQKPDALLAFIIVGWMFYIIRKSPLDFPWEPTLIGGTMGGLSLIVAVATLYTRNFEVVLILILVAWGVRELFSRDGGIFGELFG